MGAYTNNLYRSRKPKPRRTVTTERLASAAIVRLDHCHSGFKSHAEIRRSLGDKDPYVSDPNDVEGFLTNRLRFVSRDDAVAVGIESGQLSAMWRGVGRKLLSSDINW